MSLFSHCVKLDEECFCIVIGRFPEYLTVGMFFMSLILYDVTFFWFSLGLIANGLFNMALNLFMHPHDAVRVIYGTAGFLGNPSYRAQFCVYAVVTVLLFYDLFDVHVAAWMLGLLFFTVALVLYATVFLTHESYWPIYYGAAMGFIAAVIFFWIYAALLEKYSGALTYSWFGNINGLRHCYSSRTRLEDPASHDTMERVKRAVGTDNVKQVMDFVGLWGGVADEQNSDPIYEVVNRNAENSQLDAEYNEHDFL